MDKFTEGYFDAALLSARASGKSFNIGDIDPATRRRMEADCQMFQQERSELLMQFRKELGWDDPDVVEPMLGNDFWCARNHSAARLWDGDLWKPVNWRVEDHPESTGYALIEAAWRYGKFPLTVGDHKMYGPDTMKHLFKAAFSITAGILAALLIFGAVVAVLSGILWRLFLNH